MRRQPICQQSSSISIGFMERTPSLRSTATTTATTHPSFSLTPSPQDYYNITNFYIPTLSAKKYNLLKLRELLSHKNTEKQNLHLRKKLLQPCPPTGKKLLSKDPTYPSFKCCPSSLPHPYAYPQANNRRTLQFYNCKKKTKTMGSERAREAEREGGVAFVTEGEGEYIPKYQHDEDQQ